MNSRERTAEENVVETITYFKKRLADAHAALDEAQKLIVVEERNIETAEAYLRLLRSRTTKATGRYAGMSLKDACSEILRARRTLSPQELIAILQAEGFPGANGRSVHAALLHEKNVVKHLGAYHFKEGD